MRISTNTVFDGGSARLSDLQSKLDRTSQQISSGRRLLTPSDDPVAAAQALEVLQSAALNSQFSANRLHVKNSLGVVEGTLSGMIETLQSIHEQVVGAGNGVLSDTERGFIATDLQGQFDQLLALANGTDGAGHYLFAGNQGDQPPFEKQSDGSVLYKGDAGQRLVQVDTSRKMAMSETGAVLFPSSAGSVGSANIFTRLQIAITLLRTPNADSTARLTTLNDLGLSFEATLTQLANAQASVGIRLKELDNLDSVGGQRQLQFTQTLSELQDLDYNQALSDLTRQQMALQAAQKTYIQTSRLTLFDFIT